MEQDGLKDTPGRGVALGGMGPLGFGSHPVYAIPQTDFSAVLEKRVRSRTIEKLGRGYNLARETMIEVKEKDLG